MVERKRKSDQEVDHLFRTESFGIVDNVGEVQPEFSCEDDKDWEDKVDEDEADGRGKYNRLKLKYFAREVDRYQWVTEVLPKWEMVCLKKLKSRKLVKSFNSKIQDAKFD